MRISRNYKMLRSGNTYDLHARPEVSAREEKTAIAEINATERSDEFRTGFSPGMIEKIKANLEALHAQIFALAQMMDCLIQGNSIREFTTASTIETRFPSESPLTDGPRNSRTPPMAPITAAGYLPHIQRFLTPFFA